MYHDVTQIYAPKLFTPFTVITPQWFTVRLVKNMPVKAQLSQAHSFPVLVTLKVLTAWNNNKNQAYTTQS